MPSGTSPSPEPAAAVCPIRGENPSPRPRHRDGHHAKVGFADLISALVCAFACTQVTQVTQLTQLTQVAQVAHGPLQDLTPCGVLEAAILGFAFRHGWQYTCRVTNGFNPEAAPIRSSVACLAWRLARFVMARFAAARDSPGLASQLRRPRHEPSRPLHRPPGFTISTHAPVLVTGASGSVAGWIVKRLVEAGVTVRAAVRNPKDAAKGAHLEAMSAAGPGKVRFFAADLLQPGSFGEAMAGCERVSHAASPFSTRVKDPQRELVDPALLGRGAAPGGGKPRDGLRMARLCPSEMPR